MARNVLITTIPDETVQQIAELMAAYGYAAKNQVIIPAVRQYYREMKSSREAAKMKERIRRIEDIELFNDDGESLGIADLVVENAQGAWYAVRLGPNDWDYMQDNGEYIAAPAERK